MAKRIKVEAKPKEYPNAKYCGGVARDEGRPIDDIECLLLRDDGAKAAWREGWTNMDAAKKASKKGKSNG